MEDVEEPESLLCPITKVMYRDPVFVPETGNTYEREALLTFWDNAPYPKDPLNNTPLTSKTIFTNWTKRREVDDFLTSHVDYIPAGWSSHEMPPPSKQHHETSTLHISAQQRLKHRLLLAFKMASVGLVAFVALRKNDTSAMDVTKHLFQNPGQATFNVFLTVDGDYIFRFPNRSIFSLRLQEWYRLSFAVAWIGSIFRVIIRGFRDSYMRQEMPGFILRLLPFFVGSALVIRDAFIPIFISRDVTLSKTNSSLTFMIKLFRFVLMKRTVGLEELNVFEDAIVLTNDGKLFFGNHFSPVSLNLLLSCIEGLIAVRI